MAEVKRQPITFAEGQGCLWVGKEGRLEGGFNLGGENFRVTLTPAEAQGKPRYTLTAESDFGETVIALPVIYDNGEQIGKSGNRRPELSGKLEAQTSKMQKAFSAWKEISPRTTKPYYRVVLSEPWAGASHDTQS